MRKVYSLRLFIPVHELSCSIATFFQPYVLTVEVINHMLSLFSKVLGFEFIDELLPQPNLLLDHSTPPKFA